MKKRLSFPLFLSLSAIIFFVSARLFHLSQEKEFKKIVSEKLSVEADYNNLAALENFLKTHKKVIKELVQKKLLLACDRLKAAKFLESFRPLFYEMHYQFTPQPEKKIKGQVFKVTHLAIETRAFSDRDIYPFLAKVFDRFPGLLLPRTLDMETSSYNEKMIEGKFVFEWISLKDPEK